MGTRCARSARSATCGEPRKTTEPFVAPCGLEVHPHVQNGAAPSGRCLQLGGFSLCATAADRSIRRQPVRALYAHVRSEAVAAS